MPVYDEDIDFVLEIIEEDGQAVTWRRIENGLPEDPDKPWKPSESIHIDEDVNVVFLPRGREDRLFSMLFPDTEVATGDLLGYMGQVSFEPQLKDVIIRGTTEYVVMNIDKVEPNDEGVLLYILELAAGGEGAE